ncbi:MAG TPA: Na(+)/H(+) antiporter subunit B [Candidatus Megaira endosymbiont of Stentor roeselii]|jgi:multicomponent Na+:H+ antiporter subunit B|nr:Na(+)/H(+) antiporter subunit B [Rickettsiaceae bacterium]UCM94511.1 MAG: Na(+)/H(+) antiporter subunit B [Candidatus Megaira endosymbiont of Mesostigma viride]HJK85531.1 Na(+)/H(+) antiporter subunit B [Candidatus Megaera endosymbiont of Stentor roeselii]HJK87887.1 Na(+)/H(+) antiporter subunit B [Candidatus Megaira endosymbiont of Mesostigma viride]
MLKYFSVLKTVVSFIIPYLILYAIYIQLNGEVSPGGGFQAGVIFASGIIAFDLLNGSKKTCEFFSEKALIICGIFGVLIYASTGLVSFLFDDNYLNYNSIAKTPWVNHPLTGQHIGIFFIEIGVGLTVSSIMCLIYLVLKED